MQLKSILKIAATVIAAASVITLAGCGGDKDASASAAKSQAGSAKTYVVATRGTFRPFTYMDDKNNLTGYDVEILKEVEKRNPGIHFEFKTMAPSAGFVGMESGRSTSSPTRSPTMKNAPQRRSTPRKSTTTPPENWPSEMTGMTSTASKT